MSPKSANHYNIEFAHRHVSLQGVSQGDHIPPSPPWKNPSFTLHHGKFLLLILLKVSRWFLPDVIAAMLVHRTKEKRLVWEFESSIVQNMSHHLRLSCAPTWQPYHVIENHLLQVIRCIPISISVTKCPLTL